MSKQKNKRACRRCGCTDDDCSQCIEKTGQPCSWVEQDLCSACVTEFDELLEGVEEIQFNLDKNGMPIL